MRRSETATVLNQVLAIVYRSLPMYLESAPLWPPRGADEARELLARIAADHKTLAARLAEAVSTRGGRPQVGQFPLDYTAIHDVGAVHAVKEVRRQLHRDLGRIDSCIDSLVEAPLAQSLAREVRGRALEHMALLDEFLKRS